MRLIAGRIKHDSFSIIRRLLGRVPVSFYALSILIFRLTRSTVDCKHLAISAMQPGLVLRSLLFRRAGEDGQ